MTCSGSSSPTTEATGTEFHESVKIRKTALASPPGEVMMSPGGTNAVHATRLPASRGQPRCRLAPDGRTGGPPAPGQSDRDRKERGRACDPRPDTRLLDRNAQP